jgi:hypothetical protein
MRTGNLSDLSGRIDAASSAIGRLEASRGAGGKAIRLKVIRSLSGSISDAMLRGVSMRDIARTIADSTGMSLSSATLSKYLDILKREEDQAAAKICRALAGKTAAGEKS